MSTIKVTNVQNPSAASAAITLDTNGQATLNGLAYPTSGSLSGRNRIINGDMRIDQRNAGASVTSSAGLTIFPVDRFILDNLGSGTVSAQRSTNAPTGFTNSLGLTVSVTDTAAAGDYLLLTQTLEGFNVSDLAWGTASAQSITISFWIRSSVTGTYGASIRASSPNQSYVFTYTVNAANTWERKSVTLPGFTSGSFETGNGRGLQVIFDLGSGSDFNGTAGSWQAGSLWRTSGAVSWVANAGATFYITGVQLEAGTVATPFERRSYGQELMLCQRYCFRWGGYDPGNAYSRLPMGWAGSATEGYIVLPHPVPMRQAARSLTTTAANGIEVINAGYVDTSFTATIGTDGNTDTSSQINISNLSGMSAGIFAARFYNSAAANFLISAEL